MARTSVKGAKFSERKQKDRLARDDAKRKRERSSDGKINGGLKLMQPTGASRRGPGAR